MSCGSVAILSSPNQRTRFKSERSTLFALRFCACFPKARDSNPATRSTTTTIRPERSDAFWMTWRSTKNSSPPRALMGAISDAKNRMIGPDVFASTTESYREEVAARVYERYEAALKAANSVDFDDLLLKVFLMLEGNADLREQYQDRYEYLLVDEFQDTNPLQFHIARLLSGSHRNICVVGDPDQSIYSWRNADPSNLVDFQSTYADATVVTLDQSYRSTQLILEAADAVIAQQ